MGTPTFVIAPFRSGSTAVWSACRRVPGVVAFYEPLHERLPELVATPRPIDPSHEGVTDDYFAEYRSIDRDWLAATQTAAALHAHTTMAAPGAIDAIAAWIDGLADTTAGPAVFQLNRACLAIPALRRRWPTAPMVAVTRPLDERLGSARDQDGQAFDWYEASASHALDPSPATAALVRIPRLATAASSTAWFVRRARSVQDRFEADVAAADIPLLHHQDLRTPGLEGRLIDLLGLDRPAITT